MMNDTQTDNTENLGKNYIEARQAQEKALDNVAHGIGTSISTLLKRLGTILVDSADEIERIITTPHARKGIVEVIRASREYMAVNDSFKGDFDVFDAVDSNTNLVADLGSFCSEALDLEEMFGPTIEDIKNFQTGQSEGVIDVLEALLETMEEYLDTLQEADDNVGEALENMDEFARQSSTEPV